MSTTTSNTLDSYVYRYVDGRVKRGEISRTTRGNYTWVLIGLSDTYGAKQLDKFGVKAIERWQESINEMSASTRAKLLSIVRGFCQWLVKEKIIKADPTLYVQVPRIPRRKSRNLTRDRIQELLAVAPDARGRLIVWLMMGQGLRCIEVSRLDVEDYDAREKLMIVTGKGGHQRELPVSDQCAAAIDTYLQEAGHNHGPLIRTERVGQRITPRYLGQLVSIWLTAIGAHQSSYDGTSAHALRHTAATTLFEQTGDLRAVQGLLGHADLKTTSIYVGRGDLKALREGMAQVAASY